MQLTRKDLSQLYRPTGPKLITTKTWANGGQDAIVSGISLDTPIRSLLFIFSGRLVIGTAAMTSVNPEGLLNLIQNIRITGTNARQGGNLTLWDIDLPSLFTFQHMFGIRKASLTINSGAGEVLIAGPTTPFPAVGATGYLNGATGTYDFRVIFEMPFHPFGSNKYGGYAELVPGFLVRNEEWKDSLQIFFTWGQQLTNSTGALGVAAATTTLTYTAYGSGSGSPQLEVYSMPVLTGLKLNSAVLPGVIARTQAPITPTLLQSTSTNVELLRMQKQPTPRILIKIGTGTIYPYFASLSDVVVTASGISLGGNRAVRNLVNTYAHKNQHMAVYERDPIQGYLLKDFMEQGNPDSAYPGQSVGDGSTFSLIGNVTGLANAQGLVVQEQILHQHEGPLYSG